MNFSWIKSQRDVAMFVCAGTGIALAATHMIAFVLLGPAMLFQILELMIICPIVVAPPMLYIVGAAMRAETLMRTKLNKALERHFLNQIYNRKYFFDRIREVLDDQEAAIFMMDIDHFKSINDQFGHMVGDRVIHAVAQTLAKTACDTDFIARFGGEEFVACLIGANTEGAVALAERFRRAVLNTEVYAQGTCVTVAISIGVGVAQHNLALEDVVNIADQALLDAKATGRNKVVLADQPRTLKVA